MAKNKKNSGAEFQEIDKMYSSPARKGKVPVALLCVSAVALVAILVGGWFLLQDHLLQMKAVTVAGISMEGRSRHDAKKELQSVVNSSMSTSTMVVTVEDTVVEIPPSVANIQVDVDAAIDAAYKHGKNGGDAFDMTPFVSLDKESIIAHLAPITDKYNTSLSETVYTVEGEMPDLSPDAEESSKSQTLVIKKGTPQYGLDPNELYLQILKAYSENIFAVKGICRTTEPQVLSVQELYEKYLTAPKDATVDEEYNFTEESYGYSIDQEEAAPLLKELDYGQEIRIPFAKIAPKVTLEELEKEIFKDLLGECKTPYAGHDDNNRNTNLRLACEAMDGMIIRPGETFSYNDTLGERTPERGWKPAASYAADGTTVDTYGGGICQGSTTIYYSAVLAGMKIINRYPHGYISSYVDPGMDASVNWGTADFKFQNTTEYPVRITAFRANGYLEVQLWGTETRDYYIKMTYAVLGSKNYEIEYKEMPANNPQGYKDGQVLVTPYVGYTVQTYMNKYDRATDKLLSTENWTYNVYSHRNQVQVKIVEEGGSTEAPGTGTENPGTGTENPGTGTENPGAGTETPGTGTEVPGTGTENPGAGTENPGAATETPST